MLLMNVVVSYAGSLKYQLVCALRNSKGNGEGSPCTCGWSIIVFLDKTERKDTAVIR